MPIDVPAAKRVIKQNVPPRGKYLATVTKAAESANGGHVAALKWRFRAEDRQWTIDQYVSDNAELGDILVDLGFAGTSVELADMVGKKAIIDVRTYGGRTSAQIVGTEPVL